MLNALTIDLEDWYQGLTSTGKRFDQWPDFEDRVVENSERLLSILAAAGVKATFFVLGYVADQFPALVRKVSEAGHEIGLHSYDHSRVCQLSPAEFRKNLDRGRTAVEKASQKPVTGFRAPMFSINRNSIWALDILQESGFQYDSSIFPTRGIYYGFPDAPRFPFRPFLDHPFVEFPLSTIRFFRMNWPVAGGFYLRLLPYAILKWCIQRINLEGQPAILYVHPWDLDPGQPRPNPTLRERFTHYYNLRGTEAKLKALLHDFAFAPLGCLLDERVLLPSLGPIC